MMIEKICIAMCKEEGVDPYHSVDESFGNMAYEKAWMTYEHLAIAALNAMKDHENVLYSVLPDSEDEFDQMSGFKQFDGDSGNWFWLWSKAIDAALSEHKNSETETV